MPKKIPKEKGPPLQVEIVPLHSISPHPKNSRLHDETNLQSIMRSLSEFGQRTPIVLWREWIIKGCGTWKAAERLGWTTIQTVQANALSEEKAIAYAIADNKTSDLSEFDFETLADVLKYLEGKDVDLDVTGFQDFEIEPLLQAEWNPGTVGKMPGEEGEGQRIAFTTEQWDEIKGAILLGKAKGKIEPEAMDPDAIVALCRGSVPCSKIRKVSP